MRDAIELHDSEVSFSIADNALLLTFCPAYVHHWDQSSAGWRGEGRVQSAEIVITNGSMVPPPRAGVFEVSDGWFEVGVRLHENLIPVPIKETAPVRGRLELVNAQPVELSGEGIVVRLVGEPKFVEELPPEWAPQ